MIVGTCILHLNIYEVNSLKEKRQIIKSIIDRIKNKFNVSIAEVGLNDYLSSGEIGFSVVSNDKKIVDSTISKVIELVDLESEFELVNIDIEIL